MDKKQKKELKKILKDMEYHGEKLKELMFKGALYLR